MSIVSGTMGAVMGADATSEAAAQGAAASRYAADVQKQIYEQGRADLAPYRDLGYGALGKMKDYNLNVDPYTGQVMKLPSYEETVTSKLGDYTQSPEYQAQNTLAQQSLKRQLAARGLSYGATGASAGAELSQKLTASDYDKYKSDLAAKYAAMTGEFSTKRGMVQDEYNKLAGQAQIGLGATGQTSQLGTAYGNQAAQSAASIAQSASQAGQAQAGLWSGLGKASSSTAGTAMKVYDWFKKPSGVDTSSGIDTSNLGSGSVEGVGSGFWD